MKRVFYSILAAAVLAVMITACGGGSGSGSGKNSAKIKMTTERSYFVVSLAGSGIATVDWGDGSEKTALTLNENWVHFDHDYPNASLRTITIYGDNITALHCSNDVMSLDVRRCTELKRLFCDGSFTSLDVSKNTKLTELAVGSGQLMSLDVSRNTVLTELRVGRQLTGSTLNALFRTLHSNAGEKTIYISGNPGERDCDRSIAINKGWTVR